MKGLKLVWVKRGVSFVSAKITAHTSSTVTVSTSDSETLHLPIKAVFPMNPRKFDLMPDLSLLSHLNEPCLLHNLRMRYEHDLIYTNSGLFLLAINPYKRLYGLYHTDVVSQYKSKALDDPHIFKVASDAYTQMLSNCDDQSILITGESGAGKTENTKKVISFLAHIASANDTVLAAMNTKVLETNVVLEAFGNAMTVKNDNSSRFGKFVKIMFKDGRIVGANVDNYLLEKSRVTRVSPKERNYHIFYYLLAAIQSVNTKKGTATQRSVGNTTKDHINAESKTSHDQNSKLIKEELSSDFNSKLTKDGLSSNHKSLDNRFSSDFNSKLTKDGFSLDQNNKLSDNKHPLNSNEKFANPESLYVDHQNTTFSHTPRASVYSDAHSSYFDPSLGGTTHGSELSDFILSVREQCLFNPTDNFLSFNYLKSTNYTPSDSDLSNFVELTKAFDILEFPRALQTSIYKAVATVLHLGNLEIGEENDQAFVSSLDCAERVCRLLNVPTDSFLRLLLRPSFKAGHEVVSQGRSRAQVVEILEALARSLYERVFSAIVAQINIVLRGEAATCLIGVLDIAGFEIFERNDFEQLCINHTNEKLQQFFNHHMFVLEQEAYQRENIEWTYIDFGLDLQPTIDLIESHNPIGIFSYLDEECVMPGGTDRTFLEKLRELEGGSHAQRSLNTFQDRGTGSYFTTRNKERGHGRSASFIKKYTQANDGSLQSKDASHHSHRKKHSDTQITTQLDMNIHNSPRPHSSNSHEKSNNHIPSTISTHNSPRSNFINSHEKSNNHIPSTISTHNSPRSNFINSHEKSNNHIPSTISTHNSPRSHSRNSNNLHNTQLSPSTNLHNSPRSNFGNSVETAESIFKLSRLSPGFVLKHYAGRVEYVVDDWLKKNKDPYFDYIAALIHQSTDTFTQKLFSENTRGKKGFFRTAAQRHLDSLNLLMQQLRKTSPFFVRCILPNQQKRPGSFDAPLILEQLKCNGVLEGIRISRQGFPNKMTFKEFRKRYGILHETANLENKEASCRILESIKTVIERKYIERHGLKKSLQRKTKNSQDKETNATTPGLEQRLNDTNIDKLQFNKIPESPLVHDIQNINTGVKGYGYASVNDNNSQYKNINSQNIHAQNHDIKNINSQNIHAQSYDIKNINSQNIPAQSYDIKNISSQNLDSQNIDSQNFASQNIDPKSIGSQNIATQSVNSVVQGSGSASNDLQNVESDAPCLYMFGNTMIFFRQGVLADIEELRDCCTTCISMAITDKIRGILEIRKKQRSAIIQESVIFLQKNARVSIAFREWRWWKLLLKIKPLIEVNKIDDEIRKKESKLEALELRVKNALDQNAENEEKIRSLEREMDSYKMSIDKKEELLNGLRNEIIEIQKERSKSAQDLLSKHEAEREMLKNEYLSKLKQQEDVEIKKVDGLRKQHQIETQLLEEKINNSERQLLDALQAQKKSTENFMLKKEALEKQHAQEILEMKNTLKTLESTHKEQIESMRVSQINKDNQIDSLKEIHRQEVQKLHESYKNQELISKNEIKQLKHALNQKESEARALASTQKEEIAQLIDSKNKTIAELEKANEQKVSLIKKTHKQQIRDLENKYQKDIANLSKSHSTNLEEIQKNTALKFEQEKKQLIENNNLSIKNLNDKNDQRVSELKNSHEEELALLKSDFLQKEAYLSSQFENKIKNLEKDHLRRENELKNDNEALNNEYQRKIKEIIENTNSDKKYYKDKIIDLKNTLEQNQKYYKQLLVNEALMHKAALEKLTAEKEKQSTHFNKIIEDIKQKHSTELQELQDANETRICDLKKTNDELLTYFKHKITTLEDQLQSQRNSHNATKQALEETRERAEMDISALQDAFKEREEAFLTKIGEIERNNTEEKTYHKDRIDQLNSVIEKLKENYASQINQNFTITQEEISRIKEKHSKETQKLEAIKDDLKNELQSAKTELQNINAEYTQKITELRSETAIELQRYTQELENIHRNNTQKLQQLKFKYQAQNDDLTSKNQNLKSTIAELEAQLKEKETLTQKIAQQNTTLTTQNEDLLQHNEKYKLSHIKLSKDVDTLRTKIHSLQSNIKDLESANHLLKTSTEELNNIKAENKTLYTYQETLKAENASMKDSTESLNRQLKALQESHTQLITEYDSLRYSHAEIVHELDFSRNENTENLTTIKHLNKEIDSLQKECIRLNAIINENDSKIKRMGEQLDLSYNDTSNKLRLENEVKKLEGSNIGLRKALNESRSIEKSLGKKVIELEREKTQNEMKYKHLLRIKTFTEKIRESFNENYKNYILNLKNSLHSYRKENKELTYAIDSLKNKNELLQNELNTKNKKEEDIIARCEEKTHRIEQKLNEELKNYQNMLEKCESDISSKDSRISELQNRCSELDKSLQMCLSEKSSYKNSYYKLLKSESTTSKLSTQLKALNSELDSCKGERDMCRMELRQIKDQLTSLSTKYNVSEMKVKQLERELRDERQINEALSYAPSFS